MDVGKEGDVENLNRLWELSTSREAPPSLLSFPPNPHTKKTTSDTFSTRSSSLPLPTLLP